MCVQGWKSCAPWWWRQRWSGSLRVTSCGSSAQSPWMLRSVLWWPSSYSLGRDRPGRLCAYKHTWFSIIVLSCFFNKKMLPPFSPQFRSCLVAATPQRAREAKVESCILQNMTACLTRKPAAPMCRRKHSLTDKRSTCRHPTHHKELLECDEPTFRHSRRSDSECSDIAGVLIVNVQT